MSKGKNKAKTVEISVFGHPVKLRFAEEQNSAVAQQIRASLIDSYIRQHGVSNEKDA